VYLGDYDYYLEKKQEERELQALLQDEQEEEEVNPSAGKQSFQLSKEQQKQLRQARRKVEQIENQLAKLEDDIANYQTQMADPDILDDHVQLQKLNQQLEEAQEAQMTLLEEWEQESLILESLEE